MCDAAETPNAPLWRMGRLDDLAWVYAIENKVVGPSFREVAARYRSEAHASSRLAESIRAGGTGKWGPAAMPPMSALTAAQAQALAQFVLAQ